MTIPNAGYAPWILEGRGGITVTQTGLRLVIDGSGIAPSGPAGGDLSGTYPNPLVDGLQGVPVAAGVPAPGDVLTLVAGVWTPQAPAPAGGVQNVDFNVGSAFGNPVTPAYILPPDASSGVELSATLVSASARTLRRLFVRPYVNTVTGDTLVEFLKNGVAEALAVTIPGGSLADVSDFVDQVVLAPGDTFVIRISPSGDPFTSISLMGTYEMV